MEIIFPILQKILQIWKSKVFGFQITYAKYSNQKRWLWSGVNNIDHNSISITDYYNRSNSFKLWQSNILNRGCVIIIWTGLNNYYSPSTIINRRNCNHNQDCGNRYNLIDKPSGSCIFFWINNDLWFGQIYKDFLSIH